MMKKLWLLYKTNLKNRDILYKRTNYFVKYHLNSQLIREMLYLR